MVVIRFDLKLSRFVALSVFVSVMFYRERELILAYLAAILHECAHGAAAYLTGTAPLGCEISVFGVRLFVPCIASSRSKLVIYSAGPLASFVMFGYLHMMSNLFGFGMELYGFFAYANLVIGAVNLIPVFPLDGAMILRTVFSGYMGIIRGVRVYRIIAVFFYGFVAGANFLFVINGNANVSLMMIMIFLIMSVTKEKAHSLMEKKAVLSGDIADGNKVRYLACDAGSELLCLAGYISPDYSLLVASFADGRFAGELSQAEIIDGINKYGALCQVGYCIEKLASYTD